MISNNQYYLERLSSLARQIIDRCGRYIYNGPNDTTLLIDPIEQYSIEHHYAYSHFGVALIIQGIYNRNDLLIRLGQKIIKYFLDNLPKYITISSYHHDFNNFALAFLYDYLQEVKYEDLEDLKNDIKLALLISPDSKHQTINWLPMRIYTNLIRFQLTNEDKYLTKAQKFIKLIEKSIYYDGFFDDLLPKGISFSPQYHTYTTAVTLLLQDKGIKFNINLRSAICALLAIIDPEGDFNYFGRGCNQIFGWGPYLFLLYRTGRSVELNKALHYFDMYFSDVLSNFNILLNRHCGQERIAWWDYHYSIVYFAHLFFWLTITICCSQFGIDLINDEFKFPFVGDSGVYVYSSEKWFVTIFKGRRYYLCERGPMLCNLWSQNYGSIFKGPFGPFFGKFGNKHIMPINTILNYCGPIAIEIDKNIFNKIFERCKMDGNKLNIMPIFPKSINVLLDNGQDLRIIYNIDGNNLSIFNLPIIYKEKDTIEYLNKIRIYKYPTAEQLSLIKCGEICTSYGILLLFQTKPSNTKQYVLEIVQ